MFTKIKTFLSVETELTMKAVYEDMTAELVDNDLQLACFFQEQARRIENKYFKGETSGEVIYVLNVN